MTTSAALAAADRPDTTMSLLVEVREACLYPEDDGAIGVTSEPHISEDLFARICAAINSGTNDLL